MITYEKIEKTNPIRTSMIRTTVRVKLDGVWVGTIKQVKGGWQYYPRGGEPGGIYIWLSDCKATLETP